MATVSDMILKRIRSIGYGDVYANSDFHDLGRPETVRWSLFSLKGKGVLREILPGIYDYPRHSALLGETLAPDVDKVARAIARRHGWHIQMTGNAALYALGISTQVPGRMVYLSSGASRVYDTITPAIEFRKARIKDSGFTFRKSEIMVQAVRALGNGGVTDSAASRIAAFVSSEREWQRILKDTRSAPDWITNAIITIHRQSQP